MVIILEQNADGTWPPLALPTGARHEVVLRWRTLEIERRYHDDQPVQDAPFTVELVDGRTITGRLNADGKARVKLLARPTRIQFGPDARDWTLSDPEVNPDYGDELGDADAFVAERFEQS